ncbi:MAG: hypothetical protein QN141_00345 [Armatimonadota bacterium]|nr:hypothetical protein [Armatimonadota bacterium]MDR7499479.1 hypothetical protein [Armatimonadota bacterium]MDR7552335.1 hypothetical protein [Armatimonadota bacterium]MDR7556921.1 hypothetical protein [Armatimonadota bacterium]MDR7572271.1 hypothetical protein [Armatimonadota bacterium]
MEQVRAALLEAMESRRELVAYSRLEAREMDRRAREVERDALARVRALLGKAPADPQLQQVLMRLARMDEQLEALQARTDIQERSRALERDDITWRAFEDIAWLLGIL